MWCKKNKTPGSKTLRNHIMLMCMFGHCFFVNGAHSCAYCRVLFMQVATSDVLIRTAVASLSRRHPITFCAEIHPEARLDNFLRLLGRFHPTRLQLLIPLVEVLSSVIRFAKRRAIEVIEH